MHIGSLLMGVVLLAAAVLRNRELTRPVQVVLVLIATGLLVTGTGLVRLPGVEEMLSTASRALGGLVYVVVGAFAFAESGAFVGLVAPGEIIVLLGGVSAGNGTVALGTLIAVVWACALAGDLLSFALGHRLGAEVLLRHGAGLGITQPRLARVERFIAAHGARTVLVGRFIGVVRPLAPFVAGASRMPARRFVPAACVASGAWAGLFCSLGYVFSASLDTLIPIVERSTLGLGVLVALVLIAVQLRRRVAVG